MDHIGFCCCVDFFVVAESRGCSLVAIPRLLIVVTSLCAQRGLQGAWASVVVAHELVAAPVLWSTGSIVAEHGLSCSTACGIFLDQGWYSCLLH